MTEAQVSRIETNFRFAWSEYLRWYAFLSTLNLVGLGFFVEFGRNTGWLVPAAFLMFNLLGLVTSILMVPYTRTVTELVRGLDPVPPQELPNLTRAVGGIPRTIGYWAAIANAISLVAFAALWGYLLFGVPTGTTTNH